MASSSSSSSEIAYQSELLPYRCYKDGRVDRFGGEDLSPPSDSTPDPATGVSSKDVTIDPSTGLSARLYLPPLRGRDERLPVLVYYHGGGFVIETPFSPWYHPYLNSLAAEARVVAVSVHYRRVPENPLPIPYDDSWEALKWVASHAEGGGPDQWINDHGDLGRLFLSGDSAGANITHHVAMRAGEAEGLPHGVAVEGVVLVQPYFWGKERLPMDMVHSEGYLKRMDSFWKEVCPESEKGLEDPWINPVGGEGAPSLERLGCRRVLVCVGERDPVRGRGWQYYEALGRSGWGGEVGILESKGEEHVFHLARPGCENAVEMMKRIVSFINGV